MPRPPSEKPAAGRANEKRRSTRPPPREKMPTILGVAPNPTPVAPKGKGRAPLPTIAGVAPAAPFVGPPPSVRKRAQLTVETPLDVPLNHGIPVDLRRFSRAPIDQPLLFHLTDDDVLMEGIGIDISLGGMFIDTETPAAFEEQIAIQMRLPGMSGEAVLPAIVRWTRDGGMGVQFRLLGPKETLAITEIVRAHEKGQRSRR